MPVSLILWIVIGAIAGWIAGELMRGHGFGIGGNVIVGIIGALVGGFFFDVIGISAGAGFVGSLVTAVIGALILLFAVRLVKRTT